MYHFGCTRDLVHCFCKHYRRGVDSTTTVSEGQAYGMLFASLFDEQQTFDGLWLFTRDHLDKYGLMHWHIGDPRQVLGTGAMPCCRGTSGIRRATILRGSLTSLISHPDISLCSVSTLITAPGGARSMHATTKSSTWYTLNPIIVQDLYQPGSNTMVTPNPFRGSRQTTVGGATTPRAFSSG